MSKDPTKLQELPEMALNGPVEISLTIHCVTEGGKSARLEALMEPGVIPTQEKIKAIFDGCAAEIQGHVAGIPTGTRLMTKPEFIAHITKREAGVAVPMPGNQEFEPIHKPVTATKSMLIDAICGRNIPWLHSDADKFVSRGFAEFAGGDGFRWKRDALEKLDEAQLLEIYNEITGG